MMKRLALVAAVLLGGCDLYFGGGGDDVVCNGGGAATDGAAYPYGELRDPNTGLCQPINGGGYCDDKCGPCPAIGIAQPDWGSCNSQCEGLDEQSCFITPGCYAAYRSDELHGAKNEFWGCWQTAQSGPVQGQCTGLDAHACSRHDDCIAVYTGSGTSQFLSCQPEPSTLCIDDTSCGGNAFCDHSICHPPPDCPSCPTCGACMDSNVCYGVCVPKDPKACDVIDCGPGYHCDEQCYPGDPQMSYCEPVCVKDQSCANVDCGVGHACAEICTTGSNGQVSCVPTCVADPGECYAQVACNSAPPQCPTGTVPGVRNGCWTGFCIPQSECGPTACAMLSSEAACISRMDCMPVYDGDQCTCYPDHCECQVLTYSRCEAL